MGVQVRHESKNAPGRKRIDEGDCGYNLVAKHFQHRVSGWEHFRFPKANELRRGKT
jgi:hypothetical protein